MAKFFYQTQTENCKRLCFILFFKLLMKHVVKGFLAQLTILNVLLCRQLVKLMCACVSIQQILQCHLK